MTSNWVSSNRLKVLFYRTAAGRSPVSEYIADLPDADKARFAEVFTEFEAHGLKAVGVILRPLDGKLWEIKFRSVGGGFRILYVLSVPGAMVWLHAFQKKTKKTPRRDLKVALARMKEVLS